MSILNLVIGDPHVVPEELEDAERLLDLAEDVADRRSVDVITVMGDLHNNHDAVSTKVIEFWCRRFKKGRWIGLVGNHDMVSPTEQYPHALLAYPNITVVGQPTVLDIGVAAMPYYPDAAEFLAASIQLAKESPATTLFCHQTFAGAQFENGWKPDGAVDPMAVPFKLIISGHIHMPQTLCRKVIYVGAPRWRTRSDAGTKRSLLLLEHDGPQTRLLERIDTGGACSRIHCFQDSPDTPADLSGLDAVKDRVYVDVYGPAAHVRSREAVLKELGARTRGFPTQETKVAVTEALGIEAAFGGYAMDFKPPNGTNLAVLRQEAGRRLGIAA